MSILNKAEKQLESIGIATYIMNHTLYVDIDGVLLELAEFEINFRAKLYDEDRGFKKHN